MSLGKIMLAIPTVSYFLTSDAWDFVVLVLNYFPSQKELCSSFVAAKKATCTAFCSCAPYAFRFVSTKTICTTPPPLSEPWCKCNKCSLFFWSRTVTLSATHNLATLLQTQFGRITLLVFSFCVTHLSLSHKTGTFWRRVIQSCHL